MIPNLSFPFLCLLLAFVAAYKDEMYCNICKYHVACGKADRIQGDCLKYENVNLTNLNHLQHRLLDHVNDLRQKFALGRLHGFEEKYGPMHAVTWEPEMADLCRMNLNKCVFEHDKCRGTLRHPYSGQTLGKLTKCVPAQSERDLKTNVLHHVILHLIDKWYEEHELTKPSDVKHYSRQSSARKYQIGHFLQLINCNVCSMGCSLLSYRYNHKNEVCDSYILCCNYSYINIVDRPICGVDHYTETCAKDKKFPGLCRHCSV